MDYINFEGYKAHVRQRKTVTSGIGPVFGGIAILVKRNIRAGVSLCHKCHLNTNVSN